MLKISNIWETSGSACPFPGWAGLQEGRRYPGPQPLRSPFFGLEKGDEEELWG